jgi:hypothetical protein
VRWPSPQQESGENYSALRTSNEHLLSARVARTRRASVRSFPLDLKRPINAAGVEEISQELVSHSLRLNCRAWVIRLLATSIANTCMKTDRSTLIKKSHNGRSLVDIRHVSFVSPLKTVYHILAEVTRTTSELLQFPDNEKDSGSEDL